MMLTVALAVSLVAAEAILENGGQPGLCQCCFPIGLMAHDILLFGLVGDSFEGILQWHDRSMELVQMPIFVYSIYSCFSGGVFVYRCIYLIYDIYTYIFHVPWILWQIYLFMLSYGCHTRVIMSSSSA